MKSNFQCLLEANWIELVVRWLIGCIFIYASIHKIAEPALFAKILYGYYLFPDVSINLIAIVLPFLELYAGIFLVLGMYSRSAAIVTGGLLFAFIVAISINLIRGHEFDCGCFSFENTSGRMATIHLLIRDIFYFLCSIYIFNFREQRKFCILSCTAV